jgi:hypothetical protein
MRISTEAGPKDYQPAFDWINGLIGEALDRRIAGFEAQERKNPLLVAHFRDFFSLEFAFAKAKKYRRIMKKLPKGEKYLPFIVFSFRLIEFTRHFLAK